MHAEAHAAIHTHRAPQAGKRVTLLVPWIHPLEQSMVFTGGKTFDTPAEQVGARIEISPRSAPRRSPGPRPCAGGVHARLAAQSRGLATWRPVVQDPILPGAVRSRAREYPAARRHRALLRAGRVRHLRARGARAPQLVPLWPELAPPLQAGHRHRAHKLHLLRADVGCERRADPLGGGAGDQSGRVPRVLRQGDQVVRHAAASAEGGRVQRTRRARRILGHRRARAAAVPPLAQGRVLPGQGAVGEGPLVPDRLPHVREEPRLRANTRGRVRRG